MAVAFDAKMTGGNGDTGRCQQVAAATSISSTGMTVGASATLLVGSVTIQSTSSTAGAVSMTWNGVSMTAGPSANSTDGGTVNNRTAMFYQTNPTIGNQTLAASWINSSDTYMSCLSFNGTDIVTGIETGDSQQLTQVTQITITSTTDGATVAAFGVNGNDPTVDQTEIYSQAPLNPGGGASYKVGGTSNVHNFTGAGGTRQTLVGVHVIAAVAAALDQPLIAQILM